DNTFYSVILTGVHDIKNLKMKMNKNQEISYNSPWNIAVKFNISMSFSSEEIETMLIDYEKDHNTGVDIKYMSKKLYKYTSGYPFLVSRLCSIIDEELDKDFTQQGLEDAMKILLNEDNTLFDDLIKNIERYKELYNFVEELLIENNTVDYAQTDRVISLGATYGILDRTQENKVKIHNRIFEILILNHLTAGIARRERRMSRYNFRDNFLDENGDLEFENILLKFQQFMKENYSDKDDRFYERQGRLLLIAFIKPIINGVGFYYVENQLSYEKRTDMVITHNKKEYIIELKVWYGKKAHKRGLKQLSNYLDIKSHKKGYLVIFNFNKSKKYTQKRDNLDGKEIFEVVV
ncbi:MAG: GxxExxY protein, partial [Fusobacteriota bacterium]